MTMNNKQSENNDVIVFKVKREAISIDELQTKANMNLDVLEPIVEGGTQVYIDPGTALILRKPNRDLIMVASEARLDVDYTSGGYHFFYDGKEYDYPDMTKAEKVYVANILESFMSNFKKLEEHMPLDATIIFIYNQMGILYLPAFKMLALNNGILLTTNVFRKIDPAKMNITIADAETYEKVGTMELKLNKKTDSNYSCSGNVSYNVYPLFMKKGYATRALKTLVEYVKTLDDSYNKDLFIATLANDTQYQNVAIRNGAALEYEGAVPDDNDSLAMHKVKEIKIYKIEDK